MTMTVRTGVPTRHQESSFMNATLQEVSDTHGASIAVTLPKGAMVAAGVDPDDGEHVAKWLEEVFASALACGCEVEVEIGPERDPDLG